MIQDFSGILGKLWGTGHWTGSGHAWNAAGTLDLGQFGQIVATQGLAWSKNPHFPMYQDKSSPHILEILIFRG
jgi:hypothetical protein